MEISLTPRERILLRKAARIQMANLKNLLSNETPIELPVTCLINDISLEALEDQMIDMIYRFRKMRKQPHKVLEVLDHVDIKVLEYILKNYIRLYEEERIEVNWKIELGRRLSFNN